MVELIFHNAILSLYNIFLFRFYLLLFKHVFYRKEKYKDTYNCSILFVINTLSELQIASISNSYYIYKGEATFLRNNVAIKPLSITLDSLQKQ